MVQAQLPNHLEHHMNFNNVTFRALVRHLVAAAALDASGSGVRRPFERGQVVHAQRPIRPQEPGEGLAEARQDVHHQLLRHRRRPLRRLARLGYGARGEIEKGRWAELIEGYFNQDRNFALVVSLVDIRHEAQQLDLNMIQLPSWRRGFRSPWCSRRLISSP